MRCVLRGCPHARPCPTPQVGAAPRAPATAGGDALGGKARGAGGGSGMGGGGATPQIAFPSRLGEDRLLSSPLGGVGASPAGGRRERRARLPASRAAPWVGTARHGTALPWLVFSPLASGGEQRRCCTLLTFHSVCVVVPGSQGVTHGNLLFIPPIKPICRHFVC